MSLHPQPVLTAAELQELFLRLFPSEDGRLFLIEDVAPMSARVRLRFHERNVRPGGTLSGPALVTLADAALYVAVMGMLGPVTLAVTTSLTINFLAKPKPADVIGTARLLKLGKRLAVGEVSVRSDDDDLVAHATGTYSIPPP
jgi:uncharacterized protein (TIGR00369 family)